MTIQQIRERNWAKARLMGTTFNRAVHTEWENIVIRRIIELKMQLLDHWDEQSEIFLGHPLKPYKCSWCGRRSNKQYLDTTTLHNYCLKHYQEYDARTRIRTGIGVYRRP